jgi:hypothetical protein
MADDKKHRYDVRTIWSAGAAGAPTSYDSFSRTHRIEIAG